MFKTIVVAMDGSPESDAAFDVAREFAEQDSARLVVAHVTEVVAGKGGAYPLAADDDELRARLEQRVADLKASGVDAEWFTTTLRLGGPAHVIADVAESVGADVIVVGASGRSAVSEVVLGSVPLRLLHIAHRPVLVVPRPRHARADSE